MLEMHAGFHRVVHQDGVEHHPAGSQRERSRRPSRSIEAAISDPGAVARDAPEPGGDDVVEHAQSLERTHRGEVHEMRGHGVARKLVAVGNEHLPALARQQQREASTGRTPAGDQHVVLVHNVPILYLLSRQRRSQQVA
jgi:hypothetical protein